MEIIKVNLKDRSYDILIDDNLLTIAGTHSKDYISPSNIIIITDNNVAKHYLETVETSFQKEYQQVKTITLEAGEQQKSFVNFTKLCNKVLSLKADRNTCLVALGGGVIGDLVGFVASVIMRGIDFIQIPTTLLAQVDSSVGGKTGINTNYGKNLIGSFWQPKLVLIDHSNLKSLNEREYLAGYVEACKYALINDADFFSYLIDNEEKILARDNNLLVEIIARSCRAKASIVARDEEEKDDLRALLNLGHTFGHTLEKLTGYSDNLKHGEAVAIGIVQAFEFSEQEGLCIPGESIKIRQHFENLGINTYLTNIDQPFIAQNLLDAMYSDKKSTNGKLNLVLATEIGKSYIAKDVSSDRILKFLEESVKI